MKTEEIFFVLGIEQTKDESKIKNAYREKLRTTNPEDDPEGFKRLRQAYEEACSYARSNDENEPEEDRTPSGLWVKKAAALYKNFHSRCDTQAWKRLFDEDIFLSLEENEECRRKFLIFLMGNYNFPFQVWQLFDRVLNISADSSRLKEEFPADFVRFLVGNCMGRDTLDYTLFQGPDDADYDLFIRSYKECWNAASSQDYDKAEKLLDQADVLGITHPYMELARILVYRGKQEDEKAEQLFLKLRDQYPENMAVIFQQADYYWEKERKEEAMDCYQRLKQMDEKNYSANYRLAFHYYEQQDYKESKECLKCIHYTFFDDKLMELLKNVNGYMEKEYKSQWKEEGDVSKAMELARCFSQDERYFSAYKIMDEIKSIIPKEQEGEYLKLLSRIYLELAEYDKVIQASSRWQKLLEQDQQGKTKEEQLKCREDLRYASKLKISAYHAMGRAFSRYYEKAVEEYEKIKDAEMQEAEVETDFLIEMAHIFLDKEDYQQCLALAEILLERYQIYFAYVLMLKAYARLWDSAGVIRSGRQCIYYFPNYAYPYEEMARVYYQTGHQKELEEILKQAQDNKVESVYLDDCAFHGEKVPEDYPINDKLTQFYESYHKTLIRTGKLKYYHNGYPGITRYLKMYPCSYVLNKRGLFSMAAKDHDAAMKDFRKILERDPADAFANNNIGCLYKYAGDYEAALVYFNRAVYYMYREKQKEPTATHYVNLAHTYELLGEYGLAAKVYQRVYDEFQNEFQSELGTVRNLTADYARSGQIDKAREIINSMKPTTSKEVKQWLLHRAYLYAGAQKQAWDSIWKFWDCISAKGDINIQTADLSRYNHMLAWNHAVEGHLESALKVLERADEDAVRFSCGNKEKIDLLLNKLFFLTINSQNMEEDGNDIGAVKVTKVSIFSRIWDAIKAEKSDHRTNTDKDGQKGGREKEIKECLGKLDKLLDKICRKQLNEGEERNLVATPDFFYKEKYVKFISFLSALYGQGIEAGKAALEEMEASPRCRLCKQGRCMREVLARALLLEQQGKEKEALLLYQKLADEQPYNLFARVKLKYLEF